MRKGNKDISREELLRYKRGEMSNEQMHALERKISEDAFLSDAMEGMEDIVPNNLARDLDNLDFEMEERFLKDIQKPPSSSFPIFKIAATVLILMVATGIGYFVMKGVPEGLFNQGTITMMEDQKEDVAEEPKSDKKGSERTNISDTEEGEKDVSVGQGMEELKEEDLSIAQEIVITDKEYTEEPEEVIQGDMIDSSSSETAPIILDTNKTSMEALAGPAESIEEDDTFELSGINLATIRGKVLSSSNELPVAGADVGLINSTERTITDSNGDFSIETTETGDFLFAYADGYSSETSPFSFNEPVTIRLNSSTDVLTENRPASLMPSEAGRGRKKKAEVTPAGITEISSKNPVPSIPMSQYKQYLSENLVYPPLASQNNIEGKVILEVTIGADGSVTTVEVLLGLGYGCDEEASRLVKEGPIWQPAVVDNTPIEAKTQLVVDFK